MGEGSRGDVREIESWLSPSEAGRVLGTSGQWITQLARARKLDAIRTSLGWLINPADVERLAKERLEEAEKRVSAMRSAHSAGIARIHTQRVGRTKTSLGGSASD